jgi:uncharacterized protein
MPTLERLVVPIEWKADETEDENVLVGYASTFGNVDRGGDVVVAGAFTKTITNIKANGIPLLADHMGRTASVLGTIYDAKQDSKGLKIWARISKAPSAQDVAIKAREGHLNRMSIGYEVMEEGFEDRKIDGASYRVRLLKEIKLWETSVVVFPMNTEAAITSVKSFLDNLDDAARDAVIAGLAPDEGKASANQTREQLNHTLRETYGGEKTWVWVRDFDPDTKQVWFTVETAGDCGVYEHAYSLEDNGAVKLDGDRVEVRMVITYMPVNGSKSTTLVAEPLANQPAADVGSAPNSPGDEPGGSGDEPEAEAAPPAATASDEGAAPPDEGGKGSDITHDRFRRAALLNERPTGDVDPVKRTALATRLALAEGQFEDPEST